jgi:hypothetical protein
MRLLLLLICLMLGAPCASASEPISNLGVVLLQPSAVLEERVQSVDAMADYIRAIEAASKAAVVASGSHQSVGGFIVIAVRPGLKSNAWLDFETLLDLEVRRQLLAAVKAVQPFETSKGPVVFALKVALWNGKPPKRALPVPQEWKGVAGNGEPLEVGALVERIWND